MGTWTTGSAALDFFLNHLVGLVVSFRHRTPTGWGPVRTELVSATLLEIDGLKFMVTAGHALGPIEAALSHPDVEIIAVRIVDSLGSDARHVEPVPFMLEKDTIAHVHSEDKDIDFGIVFVREYFAKQLEANNLRFFSEATIPTESAPPFDKLAILGFPTERQGLKELTHFSVYPMLIKIKAEPHLPDGFDADGRLKRVTGIIEDMAGLESIEGMSGGPVLAFVAGPPGRYWFAGIQSGWLRSERRIFACPMPYVFRLLRTAVTAATLAN